MPYPVIKNSPRWLGAALATCLVGAPASAFAQPTSTVQEITVVGRTGLGREARSLSQTVSFSDLDLTTRSGQTALTQRVTSTADSLCRQLGEHPTAQHPPVRTSCRQGAVNSAADQMKMAIAQAKPKH